MFFSETRCIFVPFRVLTVCHEGYLCPLSPNILSQNKWRKKARDLLTLIRLFNSHWNAGRVRERVNCLPITCCVLLVIQWVCVVN